MIKYQKNKKDIVNKENQIAEEIVISSFFDRNEEMGTVDDVLYWLDRHRIKTICEVEQVPLQKIEGWNFDSNLNLRHNSGKFFSIIGYHIKTNLGIKKEWKQPIINQPEIGILGILCQKRNGILHFLMQAKIEPGNVNVVQISPTLQATKSNYTQVHKGKRPLFLEYFNNLTENRVVIDQLQSEQGARFLKKRNRNMIIEIGHNVNIGFPDNFCWLTLGQLKQLLKYDNIVNMDARTVLSCIILPAQRLNKQIPLDWFQGNRFKQDMLYSQMSMGNIDFISMDKIISWFSNLKAFAEFDAQICNISDCEDWIVDEYAIKHIENKYFKVIGVKINIENREVSKWAQPLIQQNEIGMVGFIVKKIDGIFHLLVQAKMEAGNIDILELAPTVQCITGSYRNPEYKVPYLNFFINPDQMIIHYDSFQSEEGGRFFHEQNRYMVIEPQSDFAEPTFDNFIWMTLGQAKELIRYNNYFNVEARSLIACFAPV